MIKMCKNVVVKPAKKIKIKKRIIHFRYEEQNFDRKRIFEVITENISQNYKFNELDLSFYSC